MVKIRKRKAPHPGQSCVTCWDPLPSDAVSEFWCTEGCFRVWQSDPAWFGNGGHIARNDVDYVDLWTG